MITTTLKKISRCRPCGSKRTSKAAFSLLRESLGDNYGDNTPVKFSEIIEIQGLDDAILCLGSICPKHNKEVRMFAAECAKHVLHIFEIQFPNDDRPRKAIEAACDYAQRKITKDAARYCSWDAYAAFWASFDARNTRATRAAAEAAWAAHRASWNSMKNNLGVAAEAGATACAAACAAAEAGWIGEKDFQARLLTKNFS